MVSYLHDIEVEYHNDDVLILVVVDNGLVPQISRVIHRVIQVLILVVVDNGLVLFACGQVRGMVAGLNPCCSGQWSRTNKYKFDKLYVDPS